LANRSLTLAAPFLFAAAALSLLAGCDQPPAADTLKEWSPTDHHSKDDNKSGAQAPLGGGAAKGQQQNTGQLVELTWRSQCANCHGALGKGDGQMGPMVQAPDLTSAELQAKFSDPELATIIKNGRGKMPASGLPDAVVQGLVARVRDLKGR
jgi:mono/diheme cytochrome c family protein